MIEITLDTLAVDAGVPDKEALDEGERPQVHVQVVGGQMLPLADPTNPQRPLKVPSAAVNFGLSKDAAYKLADLLKENADKLPEETKSNIITAGSLAGVEQEAELQRRLHG